MVSSYTSKDISVMEEIEHIRNSPGMYIGTTENPTHILEEVLDNALDECMAGNATIIAIIIENDKISVLDNGRGIPIDNNIPILISTKLFSGGKFKGKKSAYGVGASGVHGIGLTAVQALSSLFEIEIYRDKKYGIFTFENQKLKQNKIEDYNDEIPFSTKISFIPDKKIFESLKVDLNRLRLRLMTASTYLQNCTFVIVNNGKREIIKINLDEFFNEYCLNKNEDISDIIELKVNRNKETLKIRFCYSLNGSITPKVLSSVNFLPVDDGGIHVNLLNDIFKNIMIEFGNKRNKKFNPNDSLNGLRVYIEMFLENAEFSGQAKFKLDNKKSYLIDLFDKLQKQLMLYFNKNEDLLNILLNKFEEYRRSLQIKNLKNEKTRNLSTKFTKLRDCKSRDGEIFLVEGDSAAGSCIQARNPLKHAIMPLKGKTISIKNSIEKILNNNEIKEIINALGTGAEPNFDIRKLRYSRVVLGNDSDIDGGHICSLLISIFAILTPQLIKQGFLYAAETPLFGIINGKTFKPLWQNYELEEARKNKQNITRFKGLGEFSPWQLKICMFDEKTRRLTKIEFSQDLNKIINLLISPAEKRKLLNGKF